MQQLLTILISTLHNKKAEQIELLDVATLFLFADYFIIVKAMNTRHIAGLQEAMREALDDSHFTFDYIEGTKESGWVFVKIAGVIVHIFTPEAYDLYKLSHMWHRARRENPQLFIK